MIKKLQAFIIFLLLLNANNSTASIYIPVEDEVYCILYRLEAEGILESSLLTTRPINKKEILRLIKEAEKNSKKRSLFIQTLINSLKERFRDEKKDAKFIKPIESPYIEYGYSDSEDLTLSYNKNGYIFEKGSNIRAGFVSKAEFEWLSSYFNPEIRYFENDTALKLNRGYGVIQILGIDTLLGKDSQWWGPGYHGAILLTNNAEPMTMIKFTNPEPALLPWIFRYFGPLRFIFFVTRLEKDREDVAEPYLWGVRLNFKPHPYLEFGLSRTVMLGGRGEPEDLKTWGKSLIGEFGKSIFEGRSIDHKAGCDLKLTFPFKFQPFQLYVEFAIEDTGNITHSMGSVTGLYLPGIFGFERIDLRLEYARTKYKWYRHVVFTEGYRYKGQLIGHHMDRDALDIFTELSYLLPEKNGRLSIFYDREKHGVKHFPAEREIKDEIGVKGNFRLIDNIDIKLSFGYARVKDNFSKEEEKINNISAMIIYNF